MSITSYKGERPPFHCSPSTHRSNHHWELLDHWRYALANFGMALLCRAPPPCAYCASYSYLPRRLAVHWHDLHLPLPPLHTNTGIILNHQHDNRWGSYRYHHLVIGLLRILCGHCVRDGTIPTSAPTSLHYAVILRETPE